MVVVQQQHLQVNVVTNGADVDIASVKTYRQ